MPNTFFQGGEAPCTPLVTGLVVLLLTTLWRT